MKPRLFSAFAFAICAALFSTKAISQDLQLPMNFEPVNNSQIKQSLLSNRVTRDMLRNVLPKWIENHCADGPIAEPKCANSRQFTIIDMFADIEMAEVNFDDDNVKDLVLRFGHKTGLSFSNTESSTHLRFYKGNFTGGYTPIGQIDMPNIASPFIDEFNPRHQFRNLVFLANEDEGEPKYLIEKMVFDIERKRYVIVDRFKEAQAACRSWDAYNFIKFISQDRDVFKKFIGPQMWVGEKSVAGKNAPMRQVSTKGYGELQFTYLNGLWYKSGQEDFEHPEFYKVNFRKNLTNMLFVRFQAAHIDPVSREPSETFGPIRELEFTPNGMYGCWELYSSTTIAE